ncbi:MAG: DUF2157 domain-containing protein [Erythrobacter sp.]
MSTRKIDGWFAAGLIDADTRERLTAYEAQHARPLAIWAVFGIGALAIGLGLISVVAANWEDVPGQVRLAIHLALIAAMLGAVLAREKALAAASPWAVEALLFISAALGLTFFGHLGQVYQTTSPLWEPLAIWLALFAPAMLVSGRGWPVAALLIGGSIYCVWEYTDTMTSYLSGSFWGSKPDNPPYRLTAVVHSLPVFFAPLAAFMRARSTRPDFWRRLEQLALTYAVVGASIMAAFAGFKSTNEIELGILGAQSQMIRAIIALVAGGVVVAARPGISGQMSGAIIAGSGTTIALSYAMSGVDILAAGLFMALWGGIAGAALKANWRGVFQLAVAVIAARLVILSFELASDLLLSGFGLIVSGVLILAIAWGAYRVSRDFAPEEEV